MHQACSQEVNRMHQTARNNSHLGNDYGDNVLGVDQGGVAEVVEAIGAEDGGSSLEPDGLSQGHAVVGEQLGGHAAQSSQEGPAGVDDLGLAEALEGLWVSRETSSVPSVVTGELTGQVRRAASLSERA